MIISSNKYIYNHRVYYPNVFKGFIVKCYRNVLVILFCLSTLSYAMDVSDIETGKEVGNAGQLPTLGNPGRLPAYIESEMPLMGSYRSPRPQVMLNRETMNSLHEREACLKECCTEMWCGLWVYCCGNPNEPEVY